MSRRVLSSLLLVLILPALAQPAGAREIMRCIDGNACTAEMMAQKAPAPTKSHSCCKSSHVAAAASELRRCVWDVVPAKDLTIQKSHASIAPLSLLATITIASVVDRGDTESHRLLDTHPPPLRAQLHPEQGIGSRAPPASMISCA